MNQSLLEEIYDRVDMLYMKSRDEYSRILLSELLTLLEEAQEEAELNFNED